RFVPALDERQQVYTGVTEINVHQVGAATIEQFREHLVFAAVNDGRFSFHPLQPSMPERIVFRLRDQLDIAKREALDILERLGHDKGVVFLQGAHLPIDVKHLRLEEGGAVTGYDAFGHGKEGRLSLRLRKLSTCY